MQTATNICLAVYDEYNTVVSVRACFNLIMASSCGVSTVLLLVCFFVYCDAIGEHFVTKLCPGTVGPSYGEVLRFDRRSKRGRYYKPDSTVDCWITLRGRPTDANGPQRYVTLTWRSRFSMRGHNYGSGATNTASSNSNCERAYIEVYRATNDGRHIEPPVVGPVCGTTSPTAYTTSAQTLVVHVYVEIPVPPTTTTTTTTTVSTTTSNITTVPTTTLPTTTTTTTVATTTVPTTTTVDANATTPRPTAAPNTGPFINFTADFTSFFMDNCSADGTANDDKQLQCYTGRCIHMSLRCDRFFSDNCGDRGDIRRSPPGNCTIPPKEEEKSTDLTPLWAVLGVLAALLLAYWCCWRPGWFPWRLARLRNVFLCRDACACCRGLRCCHNGCCGPTSGCFKQCCHLSTNTKPPSTKKASKTKDEEASEAVVTDGVILLNFANDDGAHVREMR